MKALWTYGVDVRAEDGEFHAYASDLPEAIAAGETEAEALSEMGHALAAAIRGRIKDGRELVAPVPGRWPHEVPLPPSLAAKAAVYAAWRASDLSKISLARRMGRTETEVRRILDPDHGTKLDQMAEAANALGYDLLIGIEKVA